MFETFEHSNFEFVSDFVLRYSDLKNYVIGCISLKDTIKVYTPPMNSTNKL
jgi:hypothetical protein